MAATRSRLGSEELADKLGRTVTTTEKVDFDLAKKMKQRFWARAAPSTLPAKLISRHKGMQQRRRKVQASRINRVCKEESNGVPIKLTVLETSIDHDRFDKDHVPAMEAGDTMAKKTSSLSAEYSNEQQR